MHSRPRLLPRSLLLLVDREGMEDIPWVFESVCSLSGKRQEDNSGRSQKKRGWVTYLVMLYGVAL
jgi:hypothetical protein